MTDEHVEQEAQPEQQQEDAAAEVDDRLLRLAADFDNYKKRAARERQEYVAFANERILKELLPILDDLERSFSYRITKSEDPWLHYVSGPRLWPVTADDTTFAVWTGDWTASPNDDLVLIPRTEHNVYQKAFATLNEKYFGKKGR